MTDCHPTTYSVTPSASLEASEGPAIDFPYSQAIRSIMYLAMDT